MEVIDAQVHIWPADSPERPWPGYGRSYAHGPELLAPELLARMDTAGVDAAVLVPPSWEGDRNDVCLDAAAAYPERLAVMGRLAIERPESREALAGWLEAPGMLGVRLTFHRDFQRGWLGDGTADWFWPAAEALGIPVMVLVPRSLPEIDAVAARHPRLRLLIDHLALMKNPYGPALLDDLAPVLALARHPNVAVKATCLPNLVEEPYPFPTLQEVIRRVVAAFGPERTFWGSDASRLRVPLAECVRLFTEACDFLSEDDKTWIMGRGIAEWLGWKRQA